jgi:hypothetical protein
MPKGTVAPGKVLPPAPPPTGLGELLSSVPTNGLTYCVRFASAASAACGTDKAAAVRRTAAARARIMGIAPSPGHGNDNVVGCH